MEPTQTAIDARLKMDIKYNRARQEATSLVHALDEAGFIAPYCRNEMCYFLTDLFHKHGVEFTTEEQRKLNECMTPPTPR